MTTRAPDFRSDPNPYPSLGPRLLAAWQAAWDELLAADPDGLGGANLADLMCAAADPPIARATALGLLSDACAAGWLHVPRVHRRRVRTRSVYRLTYAARLVAAGRLDVSPVRGPESHQGSRTLGGTGTLGDPVSAVISRVGHEQ